MSLYRQFLFPLLREFDPEEIHDLTIRALEMAQDNPIGRRFLAWLAGETPSQPVRLFGLTFPNRVGVAAGFDKEARVAHGLAQLGFGHIEVGTLTPYPQAGNPKPRIFRLPPDQALINRMGFPNQGVVNAVPRLRELPSQREWKVGVSLGKQKETPLASAADDYLMVMRAVYAYADYLAVNVSSPNTPGLRDLQGGRYLRHLLAVLVSENQELAETEGWVSPRPLLVKIAPDLSRADLDEILGAVLDADVDGMIATNTTIGRDGLSHTDQREQGGLSGAPLRERSREVVSYIYQQTAGKLPIIGVGGIFTPDDARAMFDAGASLVQVYTGLIYEGPGLAGHLVRSL